MTRRRPSDFEPWEAQAFDASDVRGCPPPDSLLPAVEGTLTEPALSRVRRHIAGCPICEELAAALDAASTASLTQEEAERLEARRRARPARTSSWWPAAAAVAASIAVVTSGWLALFPSFAPAPPPSRPAAARSQGPAANVLPLERPLIDLPRTPIVLRGQPADPYVTALIGALEPFRRGDYAEASRRLAVLAGQQPARPHAFYYQGVAALLGGDPAGAVEPLQRARALAVPDSSLDADASWYLAAAFERLGRRSESIDVLTALCGSAGPNDERVCLALHGLLSR